MKLENYPVFTIIMRGYTQEEASAVMKALKGYQKYFAIEVTLNTENALEIIKYLKEKYDSFYIGAGTVRTVEDIKSVLKVGGKFILGPHTFSTEMVNLAKDNGLLTIPSAMTPSEVNNMIARGCDIVKVFPAAVVTPRFFKDIQAPLGQLPLMAVGGVDIENAKDFLTNGASFLGIGSGLFNKEDVKNCDVAGLRKSVEEFLASIEETV